MSPPSLILTQIQIVTNLVVKQRFGANLNKYYYIFYFLSQKY